jgi:LmbE family N-acetylglucosaminyl deacetylase
MSPSDAPRDDDPSFFDLSDPPSRVLTIVAHPDDIDFGTAGTQARLVQAGSNVTYCLLTSGEAGMPEDMNRDEVRALRESEQTAAAAAVGVTDVRFLGLPDGRLVADLDLRRDVSRVIREVRPDLIISQSPERRWNSVYGSHPDHLAAGEATIAAVYPDARNPHAHLELLAEGLEPHAVAEVWVTGLEPLDVFIDITGVFDQKCAALAAHASQVSERFEVPKLLREWAADTTRRLGLPDGTLTEAYRRIATT